ncbi:DUF6531 domain-containing protein [Streptomyces sp. WMMC500]|uniref:RHS repeat-associated core domain-containing protein n=1 Tax=Streptomyces sp. WMMC500 TaxID=3015154 RepID=UPI00248B12A8|nr:RHS repeat-associated core domain-containing protein [Streptomyces sp. WMMC500]WBB59502.1 DUF6531 domain-containing protein [Streptomyces sp. WMMC500]
MLDLDDDPTPGDPERVKQLARELHDFADDVADALRQIKGMAGEDALLRWAGKTAKAFQDEFEEVPKNLKKLQRSYDLAGDALAAYWPKLERAQSLADKALAKGREAQSDLTAANGRLDSANSWVDRATAKTEEYDEKEGKEKPDESEVRAATRNATDAKSAQSSAQSAVDNAEAGLEAAKKMAADAKKMREDAASEAKDKLEDASDAGIQNRKWWEKAVDWVKDNWDTIVNVCKVIVAVLGIVVLIIGGPLAWVVLAAALVVLADTLYKYMNGQASLWDVAFAALDCIPGMKGLTTLGGLAKGLKGGLAAVKGGMKGMKAAVSGLGKTMQAMGRSMKKLFTCGDPVDVATGQMVMSIEDIKLPGLLPLVLARSHRTGIGVGRWFGPSWVSTLDQRLMLDDDGLRLVTEDGMVLYYPVPVAGEAVAPVVGPQWLLTWDGSPQGAITVRQPEAGRTLRFVPDPGGRAGELVLAAIGDRNGNSLEVVYGKDGAPAELVHHGGYRVGLTCADGRVTALTLRSDPREPVLLRYRYDDRGNLAGVVNSSGRPQRYAYDDERRITGWCDRSDAWYRYAYDELGRCVRTGGDDGVLAYAYAYDDETRTTTATDSHGHATVYRFDESFQLVAETDPLGHTTTRTWDAFQRLASLTDPLGRTTSYRYDASGNLSEIERPDGGVLAVEFNDLDLPVKVIRPDGTCWEYAYDDRGNRRAVTDPLGATTVFTVDGRGATTGITDPLGNRLQVLDNDAAGLVVAATDALGARRSFTRDAFGRITELTDPFGEVTKVGWTVEGQISWRELPSGKSERWTYDADLNPLEYASSTGRRTVYRHTHFDLRAAEEDQDGTAHHFTYDSELRLTEVRNGSGQRWSYRYDPVGNLVEETDWDGRTLRYRYDAAGQLAERTNGAGQTTAFAYDALGNVTGMTADDVVTTYRYDPLGRLVHAANPDVELSVETDAAGHTLAESWNGRTVGFAYDAAGRRTERRTPSGAVTRWTYRPAERSAVQHIGDTDVTFGYDAAGRELERVLGDAAVLTHRFDGDRLRTTQELTAPAGTGAAAAGSGTALQRRTYVHRADGFLAGVSDLLRGDVDYELDAAGRVTAARGGGREESYRYDALGNLLWSGVPDAAAGDDAGPGERTYSGTLIRRAGRTVYEHDEQGRVTRRSTRLLSGGRREWRYSWDAEDQLTGVVTPDGREWRYTYDPLGRRVAKRLLGDDGESVVAEVLFFWDGDRLAEQTDGAASTVWDWGEGHTPVGQRVRTPAADATQEEIDERFYGIVTDLVGTPEELVDAAGTVVWARRSTVWGLPADGGSGGRGGVECPLRFPGQYHDAETGLHYNRHRYYEPATGRYFSPDPLGRTPAPNHHAYVPNPLQWTDPLGLRAPCMVDLYHGTFGRAADNIMANGVDVHYGTRNMDFGRGGFYVTNDPAQALTWAKRLARREGDVPAVIHFRVPRSELDNLNSRIFNGPSDELNDMLRSGRTGGPMHDYDMVEGPMLRNVGDFLNGAPPRLEGHQIAIFTDRAQDVFNNAEITRHGPPTGS